jgi:hypothetical protein
VADHRHRADSLRTAHQQRRCRCPCGEFVGTDAAGFSAQQPQNGNSSLGNAMFMAVAKCTAVAGTTLNR